MCNSITALYYFGEKMIAIYSSFELAMLDDLELALKKLKVNYKKIKETDIRDSMLKNFSILLIPGGLTLSLIKSLSKESFIKIKEFVRSGGNYIGICAGALIAPKEVVIDYTDENFSGLDIINIKNKKDKRGFEEKRTITIKGKYSIVRNHPKKLKVWFLNGPMIIPKSKKVKVLAEYENGFGALVYSKFGKGSVILFSFHPEKLSSTVHLLKNAIAFCD